MNSRYVAYILEVVRPPYLTAEELDRLFAVIYDRFDIWQDAEITLEANPDDLTIEKIKELDSSVINRLSIGIQSFRDEGSSSNESSPYLSSG